MICDKIRLTICPERDAYDTELQPWTQPRIHHSASVTNPISKEQIPIREHV